MKDFKDSWEQKVWEHDLASYDRVCKVIESIKGMKTDAARFPETIELYNRSLKRKSDLETKYPGLKKP